MHAYNIHTHTHTHTLSHTHTYTHTQFRVHIIALLCFAEIESSYSEFSLCVCTDDVTIFYRMKMSWVTRVTLVLLKGNEMLRESSSRFGNAFCVTDVWSPYRITPINWLMVRRRPWRTHVVSLYRRMRHLLLRFLCRKEPCRQREELGSERSVSFPIKRTRVTWVTRDVLYHRFTYAAWKLFTLWERYTKNAKLKTLPT